MSTLFCWGVKHWFLSWLIVSIILNIILSSTELDSFAKTCIGLFHLVGHIVIVGMYSTPCKIAEMKEYSALFNPQQQSQYNNIPMAQPASAPIYMGQEKSL
jgi:hypothetical protein